MATGNLTRPDETASASRTSGRRSLAASLGQNAAYRGLIALVFGSPLRRMLFLGALPLAWVLFMNLGPLVQMVRISLHDAYPLAAGRDPTFTLDHYGVFLTDPVYLTPFVRTWIFSIVVTLVTLVVIYPVAYFLAKGLPANRQFRYLLLLLAPFWAGEVIRTYAVIMVLGNRGLLNIVLMWLGIVDRPVAFLYTYFSLGMGVIYLMALYMLLPLYAALEKIPNSLIEAAADLGASPWTRFWRITLPLSRDGVASGCTLVFLISAGSFAAPLLLGGPGTTLFGETIASFFHGAGDQWPLGAAFGIILLATTLASAAIFLKLLGGRAARLMG